MLVNYFITKTEDEFNSWNNNWSVYRRETIDIAKYSKSKDTLAIVYNRGRMSNPQFVNYYSEDTNDSEINNKFIESINNTINGILNDKNGDIEKINIIVHWGGLDIDSTSKTATLELEKEVKKHCGDNGCDYNYKFYHYSSLLFGYEGKSKNQLKNVMNFKNNWQNILKKFDPKGNLVLEAKLNLLHALYIPPETEKINTLKEWEELVFLVNIEETEKYQKTWEGFKREKRFFIMDFIQKIIKMEKQPVEDYFSKLEKIRDILFV